MPSPALKAVSWSTGIKTPEYSSITDDNLTAVFGEILKRDRITLEEYNSILSKLEKTVGTFEGSMIEPEINLEKERSNEKARFKVSNDCSMEQYLEIIEDLLKTLSSDKAKGN